MDTLSHGLWGSLAFGRRNRLSFWLAFFFGVAPDIFSFGIFLASNFLGFTERPDWSQGPPDPSLIPTYVHVAYNWTHSLVVFAVVFGLVWFIRRRPLYEMLAWPLHILMDVPTHTYRFFPTPFLWPVSDVTISGIPWSDPRIFIPNLTFLVVLYVWFFLIRPRLQSKKTD
jgi:hypothetical protein